jgi:hypothetical protein
LPVLVVTGGTRAAAAPSTDDERGSPAIPTATAITVTAYCPACDRDLPADAFLADRLRSRPRMDFGASVCCRACLIADRAAEHSLRGGRLAVRRDPTSPAALAYKATKAARARTIRAVVRHAEGLAPALIAA